MKRGGKTKSGIQWRLDEAGMGAVYMQLSAGTLTVVTPPTVRVIKKSERLKKTFITEIV